jgi:fructose/tagatose bisphosphate aldolase
MHPRLAAALALTDDLASLRDPAAVRAHIDELARLAVFGTTAERTMTRHAIHAAAPALGAVSSSIAAFYAARARGECAGFTVPAVNIRGMTYDVARALFRAMQATDATAIFEINRAEVGFTMQEPAEFAAVILAAAIAEDYAGPVFIQGDHIQANARQFATDPASETAALERLIRDCVAAQFYCIDIDASTLVDLSFERVADQQAVNAQLTARLARLVREIEPPAVSISIGGEIGEVGKGNSTAEELIAYMDGVDALLGPAVAGLSKVSVQTGTTHGGIPLPDGRIAEVALDFTTLRTLSQLARERYAMAGAVQHGASTLPEALFHRFPEVETAEVHLATGFQNLLMDHPAFPAALLRDMRAYADSHFANERKPGETDDQFFYNVRKKCWGAFKAETWDLPAATRAELMAALQPRFEFLIRQLSVAGLAPRVRGYVTHGPVAVDALTLGA